MTYREDLRKRFNKMSQKKFIDSFHRDIPCEEKSSNSNYSPVSTAVRPAKRITTGQTKTAKPNPAYSTRTQLPPLQKSPPKVLPQHPAQPTAADSFPPFPGKTLEEKAKETMPDIEVKDNQDAAEIINTRKYVRTGTGLFIPTKYDLTSYFKLPFIKNNMTKVIKNEEDVSLLISLAYIQRLSFGIEGPAGSAKTDLMDLLLKLVNCDDKFYILTSASDKSLYYDQKEVNSKSWIYVTEMQKCMNLVEIWKSLAEGKEAKHQPKFGKNVPRLYCPQNQSVSQRRLKTIGSLTRN